MHQETEAPARLSRRQLVGWYPHPPGRARRRTDACLSRRQLVGWYLLFFVVYWMSALGHFSCIDHVGIYLTTESLVERGNTRIPWLWVSAPGLDGGYYAIHGLGLSLASVPLYLLGRAVEAVSSPELQRYLSGPQLDNTFPYFQGTVRTYFVMLINPLITPLLCILVLRFALDFGLPRRAAYAITLSFGLGTIVWVHGRDYFQHPLETLAVLGAVYVLYDHREHLGLGSALAAGIAVGFGVLTRFNVLAVVPGVAAYLVALTWQVATGRAWPTREELGPAVRACAPALVAFGLPIAVALALQAWYNAARFGSALEFGYALAAQNMYGTDKLYLTPVLVGLYGHLFTVGKSVFLYSPPIVLALFGYRAFCRRHPLEAALFAYVVGAYLLVYSVYTIWDGGVGWGDRYLLVALPPLMLAAGYTLTSAGRWALFGALSLVGFGLQALGVVVDSNMVWFELVATPTPVTWVYREIGYLYLPERSPLAGQVEALLAGRHIDLWVAWVYHAFGLAALLLTLALPALLAAQALRLIRRDIEIPASRARVDLGGRRQT